LNAEVLIGFRTVKVLVSPLKERERERDNTDNDNNQEENI